MCVRCVGGGGEGKRRGIDIRCREDCERKSVNLEKRIGSKSEKGIEEGLEAEREDELE